MYPNIQKAMTRNLKKSQKLMMILGPILFAYLFWWTWYSNGKVIDENNRSLMILFAGMAALLVVLVPLGQWSQKKVGKKQFAQFTEAELERIDRFCETAVPVRGITVTPDALIGAGVLVPMGRLVWIFIRSRTQQMAATIQEMIAVTDDGKEHSLYLGVRPGPFRQADQEAVREITRQILSCRPGVFVGHSEENQKLYRENFPAMAAAAADRSRQAQGRQPG